MSILIKNESQINGIRQSCQLAATALDYITPFVQIGVTTYELDFLLEDFIIRHNAVAAPKGYKVNNFVYPKATCISLNEVVCHGIPDNRSLQDGDILNIDVTTILNNYYGDTSRMFAVGDVSDVNKKLIEETKNCLDIGIKQVKPGAHFGNIGFAIKEYITPLGYSIVREFCGHGVGLAFHEAPFVKHYDNKGSGEIMKQGMIFTIEPMINVGNKEIVLDQEDHWTVSTADKSNSAQWEHTVLVTDVGHEILTK